MHPRLALTLLASLPVLLLFAACGDQSDSDGVVLHIGSVLPETGELAETGNPIMEGVKLAEQDIRAAGGLIEVTYADSGTSPEIASEAVTRLLGEGVHAIIGAGASGVSQSFIQTLFDAKIPQCSPSNTSPAFSTQANAAYYFRTSPSDVAGAPLLADLLAGDGHARIAIVARDDNWGQGLTRELAESLAAIGAEFESVFYDPDTTTFDAEIAEVVRYNADAVANLVFSEGVALIRGLLEAGYGPERQYLASGLVDPQLWQSIDADDPTVLDGLTVIGPGPVAAEFAERLIANTQGTFAYGGNAYDCTVILALAAEVAGSTDGDALIEAVLGITQGGTQCSSYAQCSELASDGVDIDYVGVIGRLDLDAVGDPTIAGYTVLTYANGEFVTLSLQEVDLRAVR